MAGLSIIQRHLAHQILGVAEYSGMGGRIAPEWVAGINRNRWPEWAGIRSLQVILKGFASLSMFTSLLAYSYVNPRVISPCLTDNIFWHLGSFLSNRVGLLC